MSAQHPIRSFDQTITGLRILYLALIGSVVAMTAVAFAIELDIEDPPPRIVLIPIATALTLFFSVPAAALSGTLTMKAMAQATDIQERLRSYIFFKIMAAALCEGPALVWSVLVMLTGNHLYLIGTGFGLLLLAGLFPTPDGLETKLGRSAAQVDEELRADDANP